MLAEMLTAILANIRKPYVFNGHTYIAIPGHFYNEDAIDAEDDEIRADVQAGLIPMLIEAAINDIYAEMRAHKLAPYAIEQHESTLADLLALKAVLRAS